ncbi:PREDICTED: membrane-spanning 4-domains subfamily A member 6A-like isoform X2 [Chinchilla lanigera]|uniref:membrane-spanning 4-domains subfamily A member 6A-like isoform X2 n=1 Tax=Chinchilla lanigera TaxID=34839 RepID=UPI00038EF06A|nr:PREDICTED: membrane-spanning 4-domains subfamily A member 6A-like isoform X2 [Chinchilla lanigera]
MSQPITNDTVAVLTAHGFYLPQTEKPLPTNPVQESLKTRLKAEVNVFGFIISGSLSIVAEKKSAKPLVHGSLACSILSTALALLGVALLSYTMAALDSAFQQCVSSSMSRPTTAYHFYDPQDYRHGCSLAKASVMGTVSVMLICTALELCSAVLTAVLWWKQAQSDFPGSVLFQPESYKNNPYIFSKTHQDPGYEELVTSS